MSISSTVSRNNYESAGTTDRFDYGFRIFSKTDLKVTTRNTSNVETLLTVDVNYTVYGVGNLSGGYIILTAGNLPSGYKITLRRVRPLTQETDIRNQGEFYPEVHEDTFDHGIMIAQQQQDELDRSITLPETTTGVSAELPVPEPLKWLRWNSLATALENVIAITTSTIAVVGKGLQLISGNLSIKTSDMGWVDASDYATFKAAVDAIGATNIILCIYAPITLASSGAVTVPANISLEFKRGGYINKGSATTLTINGPIVGNPMHQLFYGFGINDITINIGACSAIYPQWWGASPSASASTNYTAFMSALRMSQGIPVYVLGRASDIYLVDQALTLPVDGQIFGVPFPTIKASTTMNWLLGTGMADASNVNGVGGKYTKIHNLNLNGDSKADTTLFVRRVNESGEFKNITASLGISKSAWFRNCQAIYVESVYGYGGSNALLLEGCNASVFMRGRALESTGSGILVKQIPSSPQTIYGITTTGIEVTSGGCAINYYDIEGIVSGYGINLEDNLTPVTIQGCWIENQINNGMDGIRVGSSGNKILFNRIGGYANGTNYAVHIVGAISGNFVEGNDIQLTGGTGAFDQIKDVSSTGNNYIGVNCFGGAGTGIYPASKKSATQYNSRDKVTTTLNPTTTVSMDMDTANIFYVNLTQNVTTVSNTTGTDYEYGGNTLTIVFVQDATGGRTVSGWDAVFDIESWSEVGNSANAISVLRLVYDATNDKWRQISQRPYGKAAANADTSGATLGALETEVNELKALLRNAGLMTP